MFLKLAIIIPYYKITFFRETLNSLAAQSDQRFHVYIGNDGSPEDPEDLLQEFESKFSFTYKKFSENLGGTSLTKQWERCIDMIQNEEWFMILGDDDVLNSNNVSIFWQSLNRVTKNDHVLSFDYQKINGKGEIVSEIYKVLENFTGIELYLRKINGGFMTSLSQHIFKKITYEKYGFLDLPLAWASDDFAVIEISEGQKIFCLNDVVYIRISTENISGRKDLDEKKNHALNFFYIKLFYKYGKSLNKIQKEKLFAAFFKKMIELPASFGVSFFQLLWQFGNEQMIFYTILFFKIKIVRLFHKNDI